MSKKTRSTNKGGACVKIQSLFSVSPRYTNISGNVDVFANGINKMTLTCSTDSSSQASSISWYISGRLVTSSKNISLNNGDFGGLVTSQELEFVPSRAMDGDVVECKATNERSLENAAASSVVLNLKCKNIWLAVLEE